VYIGYDTSITGLLNDASAVIQFDTSGHFNWIRFVGNNTTASLSGTYSTHSNIIIDGVNNAHFLTYIKSGAPLMPGDTSRYGVYDMTYNPSGTLLSAVRLDLDSQWFLHDAVIDPVTNKLYVCGEVNQSLAYGIVDTFYAAAFDAGRNRLWMYFAGHGGDDGLEAIALDQSKHLYFAGGAQPYFPTTRFVFNNDSVSAPGFDAISVIMKTDSNGTPVWIKHYDSHTSANLLQGLTLLPNNKIAAAGTFATSVTDGTITLSVPVGTGQDPFFVILDSTGNLQTMQQIHGNGFYDMGYAITSDKMGSLYIGGKVEDSIFGGSIPAYHTVGGNSDFFVMKYGYNCNCTAYPTASYTDTGAHIVGFAYTGTTTDLDSVVWNFGDGYSDTGLIRSHTYTSIGSYTVCATVYSGCGNNTHCSTVTVPCIAPPVASFTDTGTHTVGFVYTGTTTALDSVVWSFGDSHTATGITAYHTYTVTDTYLVCVTAYNRCGKDSVCHSVIGHSLGVQSVNPANVVKVYPNPAMNELMITGVEQNTSYRLFNITSVCIQQGIFEQGSNTLSIKNFTPGIYILEMTGANGERNMVRVMKE
ncbi:MAG: PKD domain-containing protein, partial [Chitinophagales bacterium]